MRGYKLHGYFDVDERKALQKHADRIVAFGYDVKIVKEKKAFRDGILTNQLAVYYKPIAGRKKIISKLKALRK